MSVAGLCRKPQQVRLANDRFRVELKAVCQHSGVLAVFSVYCTVVMGSRNRKKGEKS